MKQTKAKQILAAALSAAMVLTGIPVVSGVQSVAAASKLDSDYGISAPAVVEPGKHTAGCYYSSTAARLQGTQYTAEGAANLTDLLVYNEATGKYTIGRNSNARAGIYVFDELHVLDTRTSEYGYTYNNGTYTDTSTEQISTTEPEGFVLLTSDNASSYSNYYLTQDGVNYKKISDITVDQWNSIEQYFCWINPNKVDFKRLATESDLDCSITHDSVTTYPNIQEDSDRSYYYRAKTDDDTIDDSGKVTKLATVPKKYVASACALTFDTESELKYGDTAIATDAAVAYTNKAVTLTNLLNINATEVTFHNNVNDHEDNKNTGVGVTINKYDAEKEDWDSIDTNANNDYILPLPTDNTDALYRITFRAMTYDDLDVYIYIDATGPEFNGDEAVKMSVDTSDKVLDYSEVSDSSASGDDASATLKSHLAKGTAKVDSIDTTKLGADVATLSAVVSCTTNGALYSACTKGALASKSGLEWTALTKNSDGTYDVSDLAIEPDSVGQIFFKAEDKSGNATYWASDVYYCYCNAGFTSSEMDLTLGALNDTKTEYTSDDEVTIPTKNLKKSSDGNLALYYSINNKTYNFCYSDNIPVDEEKGGITLSAKILNDIFKDAKGGDQIHLLIASTSGTIVTSSAISAWNQLEGQTNKVSKYELDNGTICITKKDSFTIGENDKVSATFNNAAAAEEGKYLAFAGTDCTLADTVTYNNETYTLEYTFSTSSTTLTEFPANPVTKVSTPGTYYVYGRIKNDTSKSNIFRVGCVVVNPALTLTAASESDSSDTATCTASISNKAVVASKSAVLALSGTISGLKKNTTYRLSAAGYTISDDASGKGSSKFEMGTSGAEKTFYLTAGNYTYELTLSCKIGSSSGSGSDMIYGGGGAGGSEKNAQGYEVNKNTETKSDGTVQETTDIQISTDVTAKVTVDKKDDGTTTTEAVVSDTSADNGQLTVLGDVVKSITEASGTSDTVITYQKIGKEISVEASLISAGQTLKVIDKSGEKEQLVDLSALLVDKDGNVTLDLTQLSGTKYQLVDESSEKAIGKEILKDIKVKKVVGKEGAKKNVKVDKGSYEQSIKKITYKSLNKKIAKVNKSGKVTLKTPGKAKIKVTVTLVNGQKKTYTRNIKVKK